MTINTLPQTVNRRWWVRRSKKADQKGRLFSFLLATVMVLSSLCLHAQTDSVDVRLRTGPWPCIWIQCTGAEPRAYGVYHYRKTFQLPVRPTRFMVHVTADNRYRLWVNGHPVCSGPARGDLAHWYFETLDIAPYLVSGRNTIAALVWNMAEFAPVAQISNQTGFVLQGDTKAEDSVNSDGSSWRVLRDSAYAPCSTDNIKRLQAYMVVGPGDHVNGRLYPWGWEQPGFNDSAWKEATRIAHPVMYGSGTDNLWTLMPRNIPLMAEDKERIPLVRRADGWEMESDFLKGDHPIKIAAGHTVKILFDQSYITLAYPELLVSGGRGSTIRMTYAEAMVDTAGRKHNRGEIKGDTLIGNYDIFEPDGGKNRLFRPLWIRTYRYLQLDITAGAEPLTIDDLYGMHTGYPFQMKASFSCNDSTLQDIWRVSWRTALLCAGETYADCPYYEQLQYEGDTNIQSLISLYVSGDDRLMRKALLDFYYSRVPEGLTQGRYPSNRLQVIPPFSLFWINMIYNYWMYRNDPGFLEPFLLPIEEILNWYEKHIDRSYHMLGPMEWWNFVDWDDRFPAGVPDGADDGHSSIITLQYAYTLQQASALFRYFHKDAEAAHYQTLADSLNAGTYLHCFDPQRQLMANTPLRNTFSQHASIMGVMSGAISPVQAKGVMQRVLSDTSVSQATFYFRFYLFRALKIAGLGSLYYSQLGPWRDMLKLGLTTFAEKPDPTRSDCHAWSASPDYDFLATLCGITSDAPGFKKVLINPSPGELTDIDGSMPHPEGTISVRLKRTNELGGIDGVVTLPATVTGRFLWNGISLALHGGSQTIHLP